MEPNTFKEDRVDGWSLQAVAQDGFEEEEKIEEKEKQRRKNNFFGWYTKLNCSTRLVPKLSNDSVGYLILLLNSAKILMHGSVGEGGASLLRGVWIQAGLRGDYQATNKGLKILLRHPHTLLFFEIDWLSSLASALCLNETNNRHPDYTLKLYQQC